INWIIIEQHLENFKNLFGKMNTEILDELRNIQLFHQNLAKKKKPEQSTLLLELAKSKLKKSFSRKLALTILETDVLDYGN
ncbi:37105_t:CDS:2, partial [Gigaspora margarita]